MHDVIDEPPSALVAWLRAPNVVATPACSEVQRAAIRFAQG
jgi:hypothetical protein